MPVLGLVFNPRSFGALSLAQAARGLCEVTWIADMSDPDLGSIGRLLPRLGSIVDTAGIAADAQAAAVEDSGVDGILALADEDLVRTAEIAESIGLPFYSPDVARRLTDKLVQRAALRTAGLPSPMSWAVTALMPERQWVQIAREATFPAVIKPRSGAGSRDTVPVATLEQVRTIVEGDPDRGREWALEEYIADADGDICGESFANYVSVETFVQNGRVVPLAVTGRTPQAPPFRETGLFIPAEAGADQWQALVGVASKAVEALGISSGCQHVEIKMTPAGPVVIEVNGRIGGGVDGLLQTAAGIDVLAIAMRSALGQDVVIAPPAYTAVAFHLWMQSPETMHVVSEVTGLDELGSIPGVREITLNRRPGEAVDWHTGNMGYVYSVQGVVGTHDALRDLLRFIQDTVHIHGN